MGKIHWLGTGLSAIPGLKMLIEKGHSVVVYNRTVDKAIEALSGVNGDYQVVPFSLNAVKQYAIAGDLVVSMLPGNFHVPVAELCLSLDAHFVSSSYISDEMRVLNDAAKQKNLCFVNADIVLLKLSISSLSYSPSLCSSSSSSSREFVL